MVIYQNTKGETTHKTLPGFPGGLGEKGGNQLNTARAEKGEKTLMPQKASVYIQWGEEAIILTL